MSSLPRFDIFLSYKSDDSAWVERLRESLENRGVRVWLDKKQLRPGDLFVRALEHGLESSNCVGLIVTRESLSSGWVDEEYCRAVSLAASKRLKLIPILHRDAELPGFLSNRHHVDFRDANGESFEHAVDRLVWPGITGKKVCFFAMHSVGGVPWNDLGALVKERGFDFRSCDYVETSYDDIADITDSELVVVVVDIFENWPWTQHPGRAPSVYWDAISQIRPDRAKIFVLYQHPDAFRDASNDLAMSSVVQLQRFFLLPKLYCDPFYRTEDQSAVQVAQLRASFSDIWSRIQRELMQRMRRGTI